jgi:hypothetical protein
VDVDDGPPDDPGRVGVVDAAVVGVVVADVLQVAGARVEAEAARGVGVGQADPAAGPEHPPLGGRRHQRFVEHGDRF